MAKSLNSTLGKKPALIEKEKSYRFKGGVYRWREGSITVLHIGFVYTSTFVGKTHP